MDVQATAPSTPTTLGACLLGLPAIFVLTGPSPPSRQNHQQRRVRDWRGGDAASNTADTSSGSCRLDVSLNGQRDYDASSSDLDEEEQGRDTNLAFRRSPYPSQGTQFQRVALDGISRDSGSDDVDSSSVEYAASNRNSLSSAQEQPPNVQNDDDDSKATGDSPKNDKYVIPARRSRPAGLSEFMSRRVIPRQNKSVLRRSFPADAETEMGMNVQYKFGRASACRMFKPEGPPVCAPGAYPKLPEQDYWQSPVAASSSALNDEEYPALATGGAVSQSGSSVLQGSYARAAAKNCASGRTSQTFSSDSLKQSFEDLTQFRGEENCKTFFRGARRLSEPGFLPSTGGGVSAYASRLLSDNRVMGWTKWGVEAYDAFFTDYKTTFIDTHCHLDFLFNREQYSGSYADYREKNRDTYPSNYEGCVAVFCNPKTFTSDARWRPLVEEPGVWMAMGCHPKSATDYNEWADHGLRQCLRHPKTVALGEIGLDYSKTYHMTAARQKEVFIRQLKMALELKLPLVIHCREAEDDCLQIMEEIVPRNYKIHCHCFTGNYESCLRWTSSFPNLFIGLTPLVTYHSATDTHEVAQRLPLERLLFETDAPYFLPCHFSSNKTMSMSHPGLALMVAVKVAELRNVSVEEVLQQVRTNTFKMYGL
nr:hypothetical protein BaRGS_020997 [Batillaria attramentaria]